MCLGVIITFFAKNIELVSWLASFSVMFLW